MTVHPPLRCAAALDQERLAALQEATPREWSEPSILQDRFVLNPAAFAAWCAIHFGIRTRCDAMVCIQEICPLSERVVIEGLAFRIPGPCYEKVLDE